jgi:hypothetical protein
MQQQIWTPSASHEEREQASVGTAQAHLANANALEKELKELDENLSLVWVGGRAPEFPGISPGRWHVRRANPGAPNTFMPIEGPNGEYLEPSFRIVEELKANDLWNDRAMETLMSSHTRKADQVAKADALMSEQIREESAAQFRAASRVAGSGGLKKKKWGKA